MAWVTPGSKERSLPDPPPEALQANSNRSELSNGSKACTLKPKETTSTWDSLDGWNR